MSRSQFLQSRYNKEFHLFGSPWSSSIPVSVTCLFSDVVVTAKLKGIASMLSTKAMVAPVTNEVNLSPGLIIKKLRFLSLLTFSWDCRVV